LEKGAVTDKSGIMFKGTSSLSMTIGFVKFLRRQFFEGFDQKTYGTVCQKTGSVDAPSKVNVSALYPVSSRSSRAAVSPGESPLHIILRYLKGHFLYPRRNCLTITT
jgi:hypothetical protein